NAAEVFSRTSCKSMGCRAEVTQKSCQAVGCKMPLRATVGSYGRVFDVVVLGKPGRDPKGPRITTLEAALFESGRPVLIAPPSPQSRMGTNVLIAWNCSTEQARVTAFAMPILKRASRVIVLTVEGGAAVPGPTGEQLRRYLQLNDVPAKP